MKPIDGRIHMSRRSRFVPPRLWRSLILLTAVVSGMTTLSAAPAPADTPPPEYLYAATDGYLTQRVQEVSDTNDVMLAVEWESTVNGTVDGVRVCLDLTDEQVDSRLRVSVAAGYLWNADGTLLASSRYGAISARTDPCFFDVAFPRPIGIVAGQHYVAGFNVVGGQYSYVPFGFDGDVSNATGHLVAPSTAHSTVGAGNGLYVYAPVGEGGVQFPVESWQNSDYLVSPRFTPDPS
jgi:hypothetical protein